LYSYASLPFVRLQPTKRSTDFNRNELKGNALFLVLGAVEVTYERILNEDTGLGVSVFFVAEDDFETSLVSLLTIVLTLVTNQQLVFL
jgi:hypothetical protein